MDEQYDIRRGYIYNFPRINMDSNIQDQLEKIREEYEEACEAHKAYLWADHYSPDWNADDFGIEIMDIIHACETLLRIMDDDNMCDINQIRQAAIIKNWARDYYVEDAAE